VGSGACLGRRRSASLWQRKPGAEA
jgi:hypothetical protein